MPHSNAWGSNWKIPDLTPAPGETLVTTKWGWAVQYPENLTLRRGVDIGYGTYINARAGVTINEDVEIGGGCHIYSHDSIGNVMEPVILDSECKIGAHCVILPGVVVGAGSVVGAMSLVTKDIEPWTTHVGVPARMIKWGTKRIDTHKSRGGHSTQSPSTRDDLRGTHDLDTML